MKAVQIESTLGTHTPQDTDWRLATTLALGAVSNHLSLVRHFNWVHLACGSQFAIATRNCLPKDHPLCRLLWPHLFGTQYSNQIVTKGQMAQGGDFDSIFSFTHKGLCDLFSQSYDAFPIIVNDPERDAERRGINGGEFDTPSLDNHKALFDVMHKHTQRYMAMYYPTDEAIQEDTAIQHWLDQLNRSTPNGIGSVLGETVTRSSVARLSASYIYLATVQHELLGTFLWNYQMWVNKQPVRVYQDGSRERLDIYQRLVNANYNLNVHRKQLMDDFSYLGLDPQGAAAFTTFRQELQALQEQMKQEEFAYWKIYPDMLEVNINA